MATARETAGIETVREGPGMGTAREAAGTESLPTTRLSRLASSNMGRTRLARGRLDLLDPEDHDQEEAAEAFAEAQSLGRFYDMDEVEIYGV